MYIRRLWKSGAVFCPEEIYLINVVVLHSEPKKRLNSISSATISIPVKNKNHRK